MDDKTCFSRFLVGAANLAEERWRYEQTWALQGTLARDNGSEPLTLKVKCPWNYPYALDYSTSGTNGALFGPVSLGNYPGVSSVTFTNPNSIQSNLFVTARLDIVCSTWLPASAG